MSDIEQTLSIIKPDAVERNLQDQIKNEFMNNGFDIICLLYTSPSPRDRQKSRMPSSA